MGGKKKYDGEKSIDDLVRFIEGGSKKKGKEGKSKKNNEDVAPTSPPTRRSGQLPSGGADPGLGALPDDGQSIGGGDVGSLLERITRLRIASGRPDCGVPTLQQLLAGPDATKSFYETEANLASLYARMSAGLESAESDVEDVDGAFAPLPPGVDMADVMRSIEERMVTALPDMIASAMNSSIKHHLDPSAAEGDGSDAELDEFEGPGRMRAEERMHITSQLDDCSEEACTRDQFMDMHRAICNFEQKLAAFRAQQDHLGAEHDRGSAPEGKRVGGSTVAELSKILGPPPPHLAQAWLAASDSSSSSSSSKRPSKPKKTSVPPSESEALGHVDKVAALREHESQTAAALAAVEAERARMEKMLQKLEVMCPAMAAPSEADVPPVRFASGDYDYGPRKTQDRISSLMERISTNGANTASGHESGYPGGSLLAPELASTFLDDDVAQKPKKKKNKKKKKSKEKEESDEDDYNDLLDYSFDLGSRPPGMSVSQVTAASIARPARRAAVLQPCMARHCI